MTAELEWSGDGPYPDTGRVPMIEAGTWQEALEKRIKDNFSDDTVARYDSLCEVYSAAIRAGSGTELSRALNFTASLVALAEELEARATGSVAVPARPTVETEAHYHVFVSHASEDKDSVARPLVKELESRGLTVWFDEAVIKLGDQLRRKIDQGLARCDYGVVILSPAFFRKEWPQRELDGLSARETADGKKAILPIWHDVDHVEVARFSPTLADRVAARSDLGPSTLAERICEVVLES